MAKTEIDVPVPGADKAVLVLTQPVTAGLLGRLEQGIAGVLSALRRELGDTPDEPGIVEYESWIRQLRART